MAIIEGHRIGRGALGGAMFDIWIFVQQRDEEIEDATYGLVTEARRLMAQLGDAGQVTAVALGPAPESVLARAGRLWRAPGAACRRRPDDVATRVKFSAGHYLISFKKTTGVSAHGPVIGNGRPGPAGGRNDEDGPGHPGHGFFHVGRRHRPGHSPRGQWVSLRRRALEVCPSPIVLFLPSVLFETEPDREGGATVINIPFTGSLPTN